MAKIEIPLKKDYAGAFKYWVDTNTENGVCTIPEYICKGIVGMLGKQPVATDTNVGDIISRQAAIGEVKKHYRAYDNDLLELITFDIERLPPAQPEQRWIPCCERLPEDCKDVLITYTHSFELTCPQETAKLLKGAKNGKWKPD